MVDASNFLKLANDARTRIREIPVVEVEGLLAAGSILIDVRDEHEFRAGHIRGAIQISQKNLESKIGEIAPSRETPIICYCTMGHRSAIAADLLQQQGYTSVVSILGGLKEYLRKSPSRKIA